MAAEERERNAEAWEGPPPNAVQKPQQREAQDRGRSDRSSQGQAESPVDSMHVDAPRKQDNARGHRREKGRR